MPDCLIHAFLIPDPAGLAVLPLTENYNIKPSTSPNGRQCLEINMTSVRDRRTWRNVVEEAPPSADSVTVVYGKNGKGKTQLLLNICNTVARRTGTRPLGVLWEHDWQLFLDTGSYLRRIEIEGDIGVTLRPIGDYGSLGATFYTTSPFESGRRRLAFADGGTIDVTPTFTAENPFGGVPLLRAARALPMDVDFISEAEVQPRLKIPSLRSLIEHYTSYIHNGSAPSEPRYADLSFQHRTTLRQLPRYLTQSMSELLAIEMLRARLQGGEAATAMLSQLADALPSVSEPDRDDLMHRVDRLLANRAQTSDYPSSAILLSIEHARSTGQMRLTRKGLLLQHMHDASGWSEQDVQGLQIAEALGVLKWSFLKLSSGQMAMLMLFASLTRAIDELSQQGKRVVIVTIDEGEMFMHPAWQRKFLSQLMSFLSFYRERFDLIHLVVSSHSLIVAGDAPPNRLFDVESKGMQNGFAAPPDELLKKIYDVPEFAGQMAEQRYKKIGNYLRMGGSRAEALEVVALVEQIASDRLRDYLTELVGHRMEMQDAQA